MGETEQAWAVWGRQPPKRLQKAAVSGEYDWKMKTLEVFIITHMSRMVGKGPTCDVKRLFCDMAKMPQVLSQPQTAMTFLQVNLWSSFC